MPSPRNKMTNGILNNINKPKSNGISSSTCDRQTSNGYLVSDEEEQIVRKKLIMMAQEEKNSYNFERNDANNNDNNDDIFADTYAFKKSDANMRNQIEPVVVFSQTAKDQFAASLLKLQADLDFTTNRLSSIETTIDNLTRQQKQQQQLANKKSETNKKKSAIFNKSNLANLVYFGWPVLVFIAMRAIEKRRLQVAN